MKGPVLELVDNGYVTLTCIDLLFVNLHGRAQKITCGVYPGAPCMHPVVSKRVVSA